MSAPRCWSCCTSQSGWIEVAIDGVDYEVRPFSIGRALKLRAPIEVLQRAAPRKDGEEDGDQREPVDPGEWLDAAAA